MSSTDPAPRTVRIRRVPKYGVFLVGGAVLGGIIAVALTFWLTPVDPTTGQSTEPEATTGQVAGYMLLWGLAIGLLVGAIVAWLVDAALRRRAGTAEAIHERVAVEPEEPTDAAPDATSAVHDAEAPADAAPAAPESPDAPVKD